MPDPFVTRWPILRSPAAACQPLRDAHDGVAAADRHRDLVTAPLDREHVAGASGAGVVRLRAGDDELGPRLMLVLVLVVGGCRPEGAQYRQGEQGDAPTVGSSFTSAPRASSGPLPDAPSCPRMPAARGQPRRPHNAVNPAFRTR